MGNGHDFLQSSIDRRENLLKTMQMLLRMKLIAKRVDLTILAIYYRICNAISRVVLQVVLRK